MKKKMKKVNLSAIFLILIGSLTWSLTIVKSGLIYSYGMGFWGPNGHDGVWHIALIESLARGSWQMPVFAGDTIKNYHIGFDLIVAFIHKLSGVPIQNLYFQIIPPVLALGIGFFVYKFVYLWKKSKACAWWATFFVYFGGNWGWLVTLFRTKELGGESIFWAQQSISTLVNPPFALSILFIFVGLYFLLRGFKYNKIKFLIVSTFLFGVLIQIKVYAGILVLAGLLFAGLWRLLKRKDISGVKVFAGSLIISILLFSPITWGIGQTLIYKPFWFLETMMLFPDRFYWSKLGEAMVNYKLAGNLLKGTLAYLTAFVIFWFGNLGTRIVKGLLFFRSLGNLKKLSYLEVLIYIVIGLGVVIPTLFIQSGNSWNSIQFIYYSLMFSGVLAGITLGKYLETKDVLLIYNSKTKIVVTLFVVGLTLPTTLGTLWYHYLPLRPPAKISTEELQALEFLSKQSGGVVLSLPFDKDAAEAALNNPPRPLYFYESTAYVSAFGNKQVFLEDEVNLNITGYEWRSRRSDIEKFYKSLDNEFARNFLKKNNIEYVYWLKGYLVTLREPQLDLEIIFENNEVKIFKTKT